MTASGYARGSSGAGSAGIATDRGSGSARYALAAGLLLLGIGALAAIDGVLLPRYFARPAKTGPLTPAAEPRPQAILVAPREEPASAPPPEPALQPALQAAEQPQAPRPTEEPAPIPPAAPAAPAAQVEPAKPEFPHLLFGNRRGIPGGFRQTFLQGADSIVAHQAVIRFCNCNRHTLFLIARHGLVVHTARPEAAQANKSSGAH